MREENDSGRGNTVEIVKLSQRMDNMQADLADMKTALRDLAKAIHRLAVVEERQASVASSIERSVALVDELEDRVRSLEIASQNSARITTWIDRSVLGALGFLVAYMISLWNSK